MISFLESLNCNISPSWLQLILWEENGIYLHFLICSNALKNPFVQQRQMNLKMKQVQKNIDLSPTTISTFPLYICMMNRTFRIEDSKNCTFLLLQIFVREQQLKKNFSLERLSSLSKYLRIVQQDIGQLLVLNPIISSESMYIDTGETHAGGRLQNENQSLYMLLCKKICKLFTSLSCFSTKFDCKCECFTLKMFSFSLKTDKSSKFEPIPPSTRASNSGRFRKLLIKYFSKLSHYSYL